MTAPIIQEQPALTKQLAQQVDQQQISHAYLLAGSNFLQAQALSIWFVQAIYCLDTTAGFPCLKCDHCRRIAHRDFPDVLRLSTTKTSLGVDEIRVAKQQLEQTAVESTRRLLLIEQAQKLTAAAANSLLKFLEDPSGRVTTILVTDSITTILPTILSRVQVFNLQEHEDLTLAQTLQARAFSQPDQKLITAFHLENLITDDLTGEQFAKLKQTSQTWVQLLETKPWQAFVNVAAKVVPLVENRSQQELFWGLIEAVLTKQLQASVTDAPRLQKITHLTAQLLHSQKLWHANVSFENCLELLALQATTPIKGS